MEKLCAEFLDAYQSTSQIHDYPTSNSINTSSWSPPDVSIVSAREDNISQSLIVPTEHFSRTVLVWTVPIICIFGAIGNLLNLVVLTLRIREGTECMEKGVLYGLMGLALSDLLFCIVTIPGSFIDNRGIIFLTKGLPYYYAIASEPLQVRK